MDAETAATFAELEYDLLVVSRFFSPCPVPQRYH